MIIIVDTPADVCVDPVMEDLAMWSTPILSASSVARVYWTRENSTLGSPFTISMRDSNTFTGRCWGR